MRRGSCSPQVSVSLYRKFILPGLINLAMQDKAAMARRAVLIPGATGSVLEVGVGSGLNLPFYLPAVRRLHGVDPSAELLAMTRRKIGLVPFPVELTCQSAERLPVDSGTVDTVVATWTLCSIPNPIDALCEMQRVLKPGG